jgi:hypothetical protein
MSANAVRRRTVVITIFAGLIGCGERPGPVEPGLTRFDSPLSAAQGHQERAKIIQRAERLKAAVVARTTVTPEGGTLLIEEAGLMVVFPRGAVSRNLVVTAKAHRGKAIIYSFDPHGTQFNRPVAIGQLLSATKYDRKKREHQPELHGGYLAHGEGDVDALGVGTFSETFGTTYAERAKGTYVFFVTSHFSGFALASGRKPLQEDLLDLP